MELNKVQIIEKVISDLNKLKQESGGQDYAIDQNIDFFQATRSLPKYLYWLITKYSRIDPNRILELADFDLSGGIWQQTLLYQLMDLEKNRVMDVVEPLRSEIVKTLRGIDEESKEPIIVVNIGCGGMEIERQVAEKIAESVKQPIVFIGIDLARAAGIVAKNNLNELGSFKVLENLSVKTISTIKESSALEAMNFYFFEGDAIEVINYFSKQTVDIDIIFHSKLHHHLTEEGKNALDADLQLAARYVIEFDDYRGFYLPILSLLTAWRKPILLNGAVLSSVRDYKIKDLKKRQVDGEWKLKIIRLKGYLRTFTKKV